MGRSLRGGALLAAAALLAGGCGGGGRAAEPPSPIPISAACRDAFAEAAERLRTEPEMGQAEEGTQPASPVPTDVRGSLGDLYPTITACETTDEWFEAYRAHLTTLTAGITPSNALRQLCESSDDPAITGTDLCAAVAVPSTAPDPPEESG